MFKYILKPGKGKILIQMNSTSIAADKTAADHILCLHAFSGYDTNQHSLIIEK